MEKRERYKDSGSGKRLWRCITDANLKPNTKHSDLLPECFGQDGGVNAIRNAFQNQHSRAAKLDHHSALRSAPGALHLRGRRTRVRSRIRRRRVGVTQLSALGIGVEEFARVLFRVPN